MLRPKGRMNISHLVPTACRAQVKERHVQALSGIAGVGRVSRDAAFAAQVRNSEKGKLSERGKSKTTNVRAGNTAAETEASLAPGVDTL